MNIKYLYALIILAVALIGYNWGVVNEPAIEPAEVEVETTTTKVASVTVAPAVEAIEVPIELPEVSKKYTGLDLTESYPFQGRVIDGSLNQGVADVKVYAFVWDDSFNLPGALNQALGDNYVTTNEDGEFFFPDLIKGSYGLVTRHQYYIQDRMASKHLVDKTTQDEKVTLLLEPGAIVMGVLSRDGISLEDQEVTLRFKNGFKFSKTTRTDSNGQYVFDGLETASIQLTSTYDQEEFRVDALIKRGKATVVDFPFSEYGTSTIEGKIYPFAVARDYTVEAISDKGEYFDAEIFEDGGFIFEGLNAAEYRIEVRSSQWGREISKHKTLVQTRSNTTSVCDFFTCDIANITGNITNLISDEKITVYAVKSTMIAELNGSVFNLLKNSPLATPAELDEGGRFIFKDLQPGYYTLVARGQGERMGRAMLEVEDNENSSVLLYDEDVVAFQLDDSWTHVIEEEL